MQECQVLKNIPARAGCHVIRTYKTPAHTTMGLLPRGFQRRLTAGQLAASFPLDAKAAAKRRFLQVRTDA